MRGIIALAAVAVIGAGAAWVGASSAKPAADAPAKVQTPEAGAPQGPVLLALKEVLECEAPTSLSDKAPDGTVVMKMGRQSEGVEIKYLEIPDGWIETCGLSKIKGDAGKLPGLASYEFEALRDDTYYINLRAKWFDGCGNSVWVKIDDGAYFNLEDQNGQISEKNFRWEWHQLYVGGRAKGFELKKGKHILWLNTREDGPKLDQWVISTEANVPVGGAAKTEVKKIDLPHSAYE